MSIMKPRLPLLISGLFCSRVLIMAVKFRHFGAGETLPDPLNWKRDEKNELTRLHVLLRIADMELCEAGPLSIRIMDRRR